MGFCGIAAADSEQLQVHREPAYQRKSGGRQARQQQCVRFSGIRGLYPPESRCVHQFKGLLRHLPDVVRRNSLTALKRRSFSDALVAACGKYNLEHCNTITNSAGRRVWGFIGIEAMARPHINEFTDASHVRTYRKTGGIDFRTGRRYVCTQRLTLLPHILQKRFMWLKWSFSFWEQPK